MAEQLKLSKKEQKIIDQIKKRIQIAKAVHTNPVEVGISILETLIKIIENG